MKVYERAFKSVWECIKLYEVYLKWYESVCKSESEVYESV